MFHVPRRGLTAASIVLVTGGAVRADDIALPPIPVLKEDAITHAVSNVAYSFTGALWGTSRGDSEPTEERKNISPSLQALGGGTYVNFVPYSICFDSILSSIGDLLVPFFAVMAVSDGSGGFHPLPGGTSISNAEWFLPHSGIEMPLSVTAITNLNTQVPTSLNTPTSHIMLNWNFSAIPAAEHQGNYLMVSGYAPFNLVAPAPGAASLVLGSAGLAAMRRRRR